jgi:uncharacterized protein (DUF488 family)
MNKPKIITIGVYGFTEDAFFQSLVNAKVDTFYDIRMRRGMRGAVYSFVNSKYLQMRLCQLGIQYIHLKELAPGKETRDRQKQADEKSGVNKRERVTLNQNFIKAYKTQYLDKFKSDEFIVKAGETANCIALFCVEKEPDACHRSLVAEKIKDELGLEIFHILP